MKTRASARIALFVPSLLGGGAERNMLVLANEFAVLGHSVDLLVCSKNGPYHQGLSELITLFDFATRKVKYSVISLYRYLKSRQPDVLLTTLIDANIAAAVAMKLTRCKCRFVVREASTPSASRALAASWRLSITHALAALLYRSADCVIAQCEAQADDITLQFGIPIEKMRVIFNPVLTPDLRTKAAEDIYDPWFQYDGPPVVLGAGSLIPRKDYETLIKAFSLLRRTRECRLLILGEGPERARLECVINSMGLTGIVRMAGFVTNPFSYMARASAFVLSSRAEGLPNVLVQAMACGTQLISTDCPSGPAEILDRGRYGRLVPVGNAEAMAEAIGAALDAPIPKSVLFHGADRFDSRKIAEQYLASILG